MSGAVKRRNDSGVADVAWVEDATGSGKVRKRDPQTGDNGPDGPDGPSGEEPSVDDAPLHLGQPVWNAFFFGFETAVDVPFQRIDSLESCTFTFVCVVPSWEICIWNNYEIGNTL